MLRLGGALILIMALGLGSWIASRTYFRPRARAIARPTLTLPETPPLLIVEPVPASEGTPAAAAAEAKAADAKVTSTPVGADLGRPAAPVETDRDRSVDRVQPVAARPVVPRRLPARRIEATTTSAVPLTNAPAVTPPRTPAVVEVHVNEVREAEEALASGLSNQRRGDWAMAIEEYRRGIAADPRNPGLFNNLGIALKQSGRLEEAASAFQDALKVDAKYEKGLNNLGVTRYQQGRFEEAIDLFKQAIRVNPANVESYVNLGIIYLPAGRSDEAFSVFQEALRYDPRSPEANYNLGLLWERRGDAERARQYFERFVTVAGSQHQDLAARVKEHLRQFDPRR
jgi:type IV pilus biogenesis/stability protein PilW